MTPIDQIVGNAEEFPILGQWQFFNHAGVAPIPRRAAMAMVKYAGQAAEQAYIGSGWYRDIEQLRTAAAALIGARRAEIAFVKNTSEGLAQVAHAIDWREGDRIVTTAVEYPANAYPWIDLQQRRWVELVRVEEVVDDNGERRVPLESILAAADHPRTKLVTLSHVEFASGQRHDIAAVGRFCRERGIRFCVDAIQSVGVLPVDVRAMSIDYLSADGHKWMLGPEGAGIFYCREELIRETHPVLVGWMNVQKAHDFDGIDYRLRDDAGRFECGTHNVPGLLGLKGAIDLLSDVGIEAIWGRVRELRRRLVLGLRERGWTIASPSAEAEQSGIVSFTRGGIDAMAILKRLKTEHRTEIAVRGGRLRVSPHLYNTPEQIEALLEALQRVGGAGPR